MAARKGPPMREQVTKPLGRKAFIDYVTITYGKSRLVADRLWEITLDFALKNEPCDGGFFSCSPVGGPGRSKLVVITDHSEKFPGNLPRRVASSSAVQYTDYSASKPASKPRTRKEPAMPPRGKAATAVAEPEVEETAEQETAKDYTVYAEKEPTATMEDFADWLLEVVGLEFGTQKETAAFRKGVQLGGTLRMEFQRSEFNIERREQRRLERAAAAAAEPEANGAAPAPVKPTRGKPAAAAKPATAAKPAPPKRGRPAAAKAAAPTGDEAPY